MIPDAPPAGDEPWAMARAALADAGAREFVCRAAEADAPLTVVVNDPHRFTDTRSFLRALLPLIDGCKPKTDGLRLRLLVAAGSHRSRPEERAEHEHRILGEW